MQQSLVLCSQMNAVAECGRITYYWVRMSNPWIEAPGLRRSVAVEFELVKAVI